MTVTYICEDSFELAVHATDVHDLHADAKMHVDQSEMVLDALLGGEASIGFISVIRCQCQMYSAYMVTIFWAKYLSPFD